MPKITKILFLTLLLIGYFNHAQAQIDGIKIIGDPCNNLSLIFQVTGTSSSPYFFWNFGDPASGINDTITIQGANPNPNPGHTFSSPGVYTVCAFFQEPGFPVDSVCRIFNIKLCCDGVVTASDTCLNNAISFLLTTSASINSLTWNFGDPSSGASNTSTLVSPSHLFSSTGSYSVSATVNTDCGIFTVNTSVVIVDCTPPSPCEGLITSIDSCLNSGTNFQISTSSPISSITWDFGDPSSSTNTSSLTSPSHFFSSPGTYFITATANTGCGSIVVRDTAIIIACGPLGICQGTITSTDSCLRNNLGFQITTNAGINSVRWDFGDPASGGANISTTFNPIHRFTRAGLFTVRAIVDFDCGQDTLMQIVQVSNCATSDDSCWVFIGNVFTPNADGINDTFYPITECPLETVEFIIFSRWGQLIYQSNNPDDRWKGTYKGKDCPEGVYVFVINYQFPLKSPQRLRGSVTLLR